MLALERFPYWHDRKFGVQALLSQGRVDEAVAYCEAPRDLNQPDATIDAADAEKILLDLGRVDEACREVCPGKPRMALRTAWPRLRVMQGKKYAR